MHRLKTAVFLIAVMAFVSSINVFAEDRLSGTNDTGREVNVIKKKGDDKTIIYSGDLAGYAGGLYADVDLENAQLMMLFKWEEDDSDDEMIFIVPAEGQSKEAFDKAEQIHTADDTPPANVLHNGAAQISSNIMLVYDNTYYENVILPGKTLNIPITVTNTESETKQLVSYVAKYSLDGRLTEMIQGETITAPSNQTVTSNLLSRFSADEECTAKVFIWEKDTMEPVSDSICLTVQNQDYYADTYPEARSIELERALCGVINTGEDVDIVKYTPDVSGVYAIKMSAEEGVVFGLYDSAQSILNSITFSGEQDNYLLYELSQGNSYYLRFTGTNGGSYKIIPSKPDDINTILKNTGIAANLSDSDVFNIYRFIPAETGEYIITAVGNSNVKAKLYNSDYELVASDSTGDEGVSFRITSGMTSGEEYYIIAEAKADFENELLYSVYVEEPFSLIAVQ